MARRKKFIKLKIPFLKNVKVKREIFAHIIGLLLFTVSIIIFISYFQKGSMLDIIHDSLALWFGILSIMIPTIILMISTHFFSSKKLKILKVHVTVGVILMTLSMFGFFRSGTVGDLISRSLTADFSGIGAFFILLIIFTLGVILFFNTSLDVFLTLVLSVIKSGIMWLYNQVFAGLFSKGEGKNDEKKDDKPVYISQETTHKPVPAGVVVNTRPAPSAPVDESGIDIKPMTGHAAENWAFPPISLLKDIENQKADAGDIAQNSNTIEQTFDSFGINAKVEELNQGPTVTQYAINIARGTKLTKVTALSNDLALALAAPTGQVRIEAPIPGRSLVGIEIPNRRSEIVTLKQMLSEPDMRKDPHPLSVPLGLDVSGKPVFGNLNAMPHVLVAGTTGAGKSVLLNSWICSLLFRTTPDDVRLILVDPKRVEMTGYNGIPHLLTEVIVEPDKIIAALKWTVAEMDRRYKMFAKVGARNIESYNQKHPEAKVPFIVFIIDELADLMMVSAREAEEYITRIAQMARATGIHMILATQRPSVNVITGLMKANIPSRIAFNVPSLIDSRVVLDMPGAEKLIGKGDMLYLPSDQAKPRRIQSAYLSESDVNEVVGFLKQKAPPVHYTDEVTQVDTQSVTLPSGESVSGIEDADALFGQAVDLIYADGKASASLIQRKLSVGYARAARILDQLEEAGIVGPQQGSKPRELITRSTPMPEQLAAQDMQDELNGIH